MEQRSSIPGQGWGGITASPCKHLLGGDGRYDDSLRVLGSQRFLPRPRLCPSHVRPPPLPPYAVVVIVIVIAIVVPIAHLSSSLSPPSKFAPPDATWCQGTARRNKTGSGIARRGGGRLSPMVNDDNVDIDEDNIFCHHGIIDPLRYCNCASAAAVVVVQVIVPVIDSISMAPRIRAQNSAAVNYPEKTTIPVSSSSITNGLDGINGIVVRG